MGKAKHHHRHPAAQKPEPAAAKTGTRWPALTGLRGLAAAGVLGFHIYVLAGSPAYVPAPLAWLLSIGWSGVDVFFTLSAFLLTLPWCEAQAGGRPAPSWREYWRHRAWRILPAYYAQLLVIAVLAFAGAAAASSWSQPGALGFAVNALFLYNIVPGQWPALPQWWTLPVELGFYLLLPLFVPLLTPRRWPWLLLAIAASLAWRFGVIHAGLERAQEIAWTEHLPGRLHQFLIGMLAAWVLVRWRALFAAWSVLQRDLIASLSILAFLALPALALPFSGRPYNGAPGPEPLLLCWHLFASLLVALLLVVLAAGASRVGRWLGASWLQALGLVSYSLYLWHYPVLLALREGLGGFQAIKADFWPFAFYSLLFTLLVAGAAWWLVERPALERARRDKMPA
jgi:peptidoglycan/LPS O-acetylase OafA/YrhL